MSRLTKVWSNGLMIICLLVLFAGCRESENREDRTRAAINPAAQGFNAAASDSTAITIADSVMQAMGGRRNWDDTKIIQWNFFGRRTHTWNKQTGRDSIYISDQNMVIDMNINSKEGQVWKEGEKVTQPDTSKKYLQQGYQMWVNDAYWLLMPYKLKDTGVTLEYMGMDSMQTGEPAYKLQLTFDSVGVTPENKYHVYVDTTDYLVRQWAHFSKAEMQEPGFVMPWNNYQQHGDILLSGDRGQYQISDIKVMDEWPKN